MRIKFEIEGKPQGKARPRVTRYGTYTPKKTHEYEELVKWSFMRAGKGFFAQKDVGVGVYIEAFYKIPENRSKKDKEAMLRGEIRPKVKPDLDNIAKVICDALNGIAYHDDNQLIEMQIIKKYGEPRVEVTLWEVEDE